MEVANVEASIDVIQAINRALGSHRPLLIRRLEWSKHPSESDHAKPEKNTSDLADMTTQSNEVLFKASSVFPFNLFPDTVTIDCEKVTFANRFFFRVAKINSTPIQDIQSIEADVGPFFGTIKMSSKYFITNPREVTFLKRQDAITIQHLIQGCVIAFERKMDCSEMPKEALVSMLKELGTGDTD